MLYAICHMPQIPVVAISIAAVASCALYWHLVHQHKISSQHTNSPRTAPLLPLPSPSTPSCYLQLPPMDCLSRSPCLSVSLTNPPTCTRTSASFYIKCWSGSLRVREAAYHGRQNGLPSWPQRTVTIIIETHTRSMINHSHWRVSAFHLIIK